MTADRERLAQIRRQWNDSQGDVADEDITWLLDRLDALERLVDENVLQWSESIDAHRLAIRKLGELLTETRESRARVAASGIHRSLKLAEECDAARQEAENARNALYGMTKRYDEVNQEAEALRAENAALVEALKFYAEPTNYNFVETRQGDGLKYVHQLVSQDCGDKARKALSAPATAQAGARLRAMEAVFEAARRVKAADMGSASTHDYYTAYHALMLAVDAVALVDGATD